MTDEPIALGRRRWPIVVAGLSLLAFEVMRELYVLEANKPRFLIAPAFYLLSDGDEVSAQGAWKRSDGGSEIVQGSVVIRCVRKWGACVEVNNTYMPDVNALNSFLEVQPNASFSADAVEFSNENECGTYRVRLDLNQSRVTATRERRSGTLPDECMRLEDRVAMEMADGDRHVDRVNAEWTRGYFLPIYRLLLPLLDG